MLWPHGREVQPGRDRVRLFDLPFVGLHHRRFHAEVDPYAAMLQRRAVLAGFDTVAGRLHADQPDAGLVNKVGKHADGV